MNEFTIETTIARPIAGVFAYAANAENIPLYSPMVTEAHMDSDTQTIGVHTTMKGRFLKIPYETVWETTDYKEDEVLAAKTVSGPFDMEVNHRFESVEGGTRMTSHWRGDSKGFFKLAEPVMVRLTKRQLETAAETMKELLEADA
jgi:uncharacterized protein YndB with AHSA1/START domain